MPVVKVHDMIACAGHERDHSGSVPLLLALWPPQGLEAPANKGGIIGDRRGCSRRGSGWGGGSRGDGGRGSSDGDKRRGRHNPPRRTHYLY